MSAARPDEDFPLNTAPAITSCPPKRTNARGPDLKTPRLDLVFQHLQRGPRK
ncbi:MAG: hypothetical protein QOF42_298 [Gammaproteobacteria bacterium]|jgi:hypothetical protein|nr:hypothetical protein [Gammaproteobacteria bacterium]